MSGQMKNTTHYSASDIQRYLNGEMSAREMFDLEKAALEDPFLADAIEGYDAHPTAAGDLVLPYKYQIRTTNRRNRKGRASTGRTCNGRLCRPLNRISRTRQRIRRTRHYTKSRKTKTRQNLQTISRHNTKGPCLLTTLKRGVPARSRQIKRRQHSIQRPRRHTRPGHFRKKGRPTAVRHPHTVVRRPGLQKKPGIPVLRRFSPRRRHIPHENLLRQSPRLQQ